MNTDRSRWMWAWLAAAVALGCGQAEQPAGYQSARGPRMSATVYPGRPPHPVVQLSLHRTPRLHPVADEPAKQVRLDATHGLIDLGPDGKLVGWSFGGQIPGPTVRLRVGDRVRFTMTNRTDEPIAGLTFEGRPHSIEIGGVLIDREDSGRLVAPGETLDMELTAMDPGVHLYRSGHPSGAEPVAAGMYGMLVVDPAGGFDPPADREYAIVQSEVYAGADPEGRHLGKSPVKLLDGRALAAKRPTHFGYAGQFAGSGLVLPAQVGERLRLFVLNAGPHATARFQIKGLPVDNLWPADAIDPKAPDAGLAVLPPGRGAVLEVVVGSRERFAFGDQQLAGRGLAGIIDAAPGDDKPAPVLAPPPRNAAERRERGKALYADRCGACHSPQPGMMRLAPDLAGVGQRRNRQWLVSWLADPPKMQVEDEVAKQLLREWNGVPMPQLMLSPEQIDWVLEFLGVPAPTKRRG
jgi:nitrite reductase (NO-forming)